ncbi:hypothetical protein FACS1894193_02940 [Bacilli bacterium]|nr:hypothetical protein FACS1894193_02940 [Bacilli bacterium]GHU45970.1 hypothetical protein FACS1894194_2810 [Bacilli bacterium]
MEKTVKVSAGHNHMNREIKAMLGLLSYRECEILDVQTPPNLLISCYDEMGTSEKVCP